MQSWRYPLGSVRGVPVQAHLSLLLMAAFLSARQSDLAGMALLFVLLVGLVGLHEAAHAVAGLWRGYAVQKLPLHAFAGVSSLHQPPLSSLDDVLITLAGPVLSLGAGAILVWIASALPPLGSWGEGVRTAGFSSLYWGAFNLLPAYPMDGGRLLYQALSRRQPPVEAAQSSLKASQWVHFLIGLSGVLAFRLSWIALALYLYLTGLAVAYEALQQARSAVDTATVSPPPYARTRPPSRVKLRREE